MACLSGHYSATPSLTQMGRILIKKKSRTPAPAPALALPSPVVSSPCAYNSREGWRRFFSSSLLLNRCLLGLFFPPPPPPGFSPRSLQSSRANFPLPPLASSPRTIDADYIQPNLIRLPTAIFRDACSNPTYLYSR